MARPIVLSNGELHVGLNVYGLVHDFYFPYVGLENHSLTGPLRHKVGVYVDDQISWLDDDNDWQITMDYQPTALIGKTRAKNERLGIQLDFQDFVDSSLNAFERNVAITNLWDTEREVRLFMHQAFIIGDSHSHTDTVQYLPDSQAVLHYRGDRVFVIGGLHSNQPFDQHSLGLFGIEGREGTFRDADDGELSNGGVEHGQVDSVIRFKFQVAPHQSTLVQYWIAAGTSLRDALSVHNRVAESGPVARARLTADWWRKWLTPALKKAEFIPDKYRDKFIRSVMIIKSQIDKRGAIMASTDTGMLKHWRDAYSYSWPRDGAYIVWPLLRLGYTDEAYQFFEFCKRGLHPAGYLMHKYRADGALGSSWHPYTHEGCNPGPPIQEDETALVLFVLTQHLISLKDQSVINQFYDSLVTPMASFLARYVDESTGLPRPSYDLWEEKYLVSTYSTAVTYAALHAAAELADTQDDSELAVTWRAAAEDIGEAAQRYLYNDERQTFYKGVLSNKDTGEMHRNDTIDISSIYGSFMYGLFPIDSDELKSSIRTALDVFGYNNGQLGFPRYEHDDYLKAAPETLGNYWLLTTLWVCQYFIEVDRHTEATKLLDWVSERAFPSGVMSEQVHPHTNEPISVAPLTWSHAEYVATLLDYTAGR